MLDIPSFFFGMAFLASVFDMIHHSTGSEPRSLTRSGENSVLAAMIPRPEYIALCTIAGWENRIPF